MRKGRFAIAAVSLVALVSCSPEGDEPATPADEVLRGSRRAMGGESAARGIGFARFRAAATGPEGGYEVTVHANAEGDVRLDFSLGFSGSATSDDGWVRFGPGEPIASLTDTLETFVRGHDLLMNALHPETRYGPLRLIGERTFVEVEAFRLDGVDALGAPIEFYYSRADTLPLGFRLLDHLRGAGPVTTLFLDWQRRGDVRLPMAARFVQGDEVFEYEMAEVETGETGDADVFQPDSDVSG
ncbi:MAG: hypothetical protein OEU54_12935 [Gemmatimonadota bacterium]|nr:hypothetical protein [Gemmatimonadota bacterium]